MHFRYLLHLLALTFILQTARASFFCTGRGGPRLVTINPPTLFDPTPFAYAHITVDRKNAVAHIAGQVAINQTGSIIGNTLAEQLLETERNLMLAMEAVESDIGDILRVNGFLLNFDPNTDLATYQETGRRLGSPVTTIVSTGSLAIEGLLVEIEMDVAVSHSFVRRLVCS